MNVREAKQTAIRWLEANAPEIPGFKGAMIAGSTNWKDPDAEWRDTSDIDVWIMTEDKKLAPRQRKTLFEGVIVEAVCHNLSDFTDAEWILSDPYSADHFYKGGVVSDPTGVLSEVQRKVQASFADPEWTHKRMDNCFRRVRGAFGKVIDDPAAFGRAQDFVFGVRQTAALCPVAKHQPPTLRKCLVVSKDILVSIGRAELHEEMLDVLGSREFSRADAEELRNRTIPMFDCAVRVLKKPFWPDFEFVECARPICLGGITELIETGFHRESVFFAIFIQNASLKAIRNDASEEEKARFSEEFRESLRAIGVNAPEDFVPRAQRGIETMEKVNGAMRGAMKRD